MIEISEIDFKGFLIPDNEDWECDGPDMSYVLQQLYAQMMGWA